MLRKEHLGVHQGSAPRDPGDDPGGERIDFRSLRYGQGLVCPLTESGEGEGHLRWPLQCQGEPKSSEVSVARNR